jgi:hypothetical protein
VPDGGTRKRLSRGKRSARDSEIRKIDDPGEEGDPYKDYLAEGSLEPVECVLGDEEEAISNKTTFRGPRGGERA